MGKLLDDLIGIRNRAIGDVDAGSRNRNEPVEPVRNRTRFMEAKSKPKKKTFSAWMSEVEDEIEAVTGMDMDVFADLPWGKFFKDGYSPQEAVQDGLRQAEEGEDDDDAISFREWSERVDKGLKRAGKPTLSKIREENDLTSSEIHQIFMDNRSPKKAVEVLSDLYEDGREVEVEEEEVEAPVLRRRGHTSKNVSMPSLEEWMRAIDEAEPVYDEEDFQEEIPIVKSSPVTGKRRSVTEEMDPADFLSEDDLHRSVSVGAQAYVTPAPMPIRPPSVSDVMSSMPSVESLMNSSTHQSAPVNNTPPEQLADMTKSLIKKEEDDDLLEGINEVLPTDPDDVDFDIVGAALGTSDIGRTLPTVQTKAFDFSKFIPAMNAANAVGTSLAKAISEEEGARYVFDKKSGDPSRSDGRSLWFELCPPDKSDKKKYFLCLSYNDTMGESEDGTPIEVILWDVSLRKGDTRDDSEEIVSDSGIEEEALKSVVGAIPSCFVE